MRALLVALATPDPASLRTALAAALGATSVDLCQATEAAVTWLENRPCDLVAIAGQGSAVVEAVGRLRRVSKTIPVLAVVPDPSARDAGAAWLCGADDVVTASNLVAGTLPEGLDEVRHPERDVLRKTQRLWYAGPGDALRQQLATRLGTRFREVGLSAEGLAGLTTQDVEAPHSAALIVNASAEPDALVLGVRRVKRTYPGLAITVVADSQYHDAFRRAGADECVHVSTDADPVLHAVGRAQAACRAALELDTVRARETRLRALLEHLPEAVMLVSPEHAVLAVNLAALRLIGAQDARQVLGSPLAPWFEADDEQPDSAVALVDGVAGGAARELVMRTRHLADPRRLQLRAVPFQRETGGPPAALMVLREMLETPVVEVTPLVTAGTSETSDEERQAWQDERAALHTQLTALASELVSARERLTSADAVVAELAATREDLSAARAFDDTRREAQDAAAADAALLQELRARLDRLEALGVDVDEVPALLDAARRLALLEDEVPAMMARIEAERREHEDEVTRLRDAVANLEARDEAPEPTAAAESTASLALLQDAALRLADLEATELPALREAAAAATAERDQSAGALADATHRAAELEAALADAWAHKTRLEQELLAAGQAPHAPAESDAPVDVPAAHGWILQDIAQVGFVRTTAEGRIVEANDHAARLCGYRSAAALVDFGVLPLPLTLLADGDDAAPTRFEVCLQVAEGRPPRWIAGARLPKADDTSDQTWLLADASAHRTDTTSDPERPDTLNAVLEVVASECAVIVDDAPLAFRGPRPLDAAPAATPAAAQALDRARVLLAQVSAFRRRREGQTALDELRTHLAALDPVLQRLATDDVSWELSLPDDAVHVGVSSSDVERCLMALVTSGRDALPLGGKLALSVRTPAAGGAPGASEVLRLDAHLVLDAQGYGVADIELPVTLRDLAAGFGGVIEVVRIDALTQRLSLRVPRAFVVSHAA